MLELLHAAERDRVVGHHARRVLALAGPARSRPAEAARPGIAPLADPLSERELQVLRLLDSELSGPEIARDAVHLPQHPAHPHQARLHQARRLQPPGSGGPRP